MAALPNSALSGGDSLQQVRSYQDPILFDASTAEMSPLGFSRGPARGTRRAAEVITGISQRLATQLGEANSLSSPQQIESMQFLTAKRAKSAKQLGLNQKTEPIGPIDQGRYHANDQWVMCGFVSFLRAPCVFAVNHSRGLQNSAGEKPRSRRQEGSPGLDGGPFRPLGRDRGPGRVRAPVRLAV